MTLGNDLAVAELAVSVLGFGLAIWQLWRTRSAVERTEERLKFNELLFELPQLQRAEQDLDDAVNSGIDHTIRALNNWRRQAGTVIAFLESQGSADDLVVELHSSIALAGAAKNALVEGKTNPIVVTKDARASIERVCRDLPQVATQLRASSGGEEKARA